jgi:hypothetical protein
MSFYPLLGYNERKRDKVVGLLSNRILTDDEGFLVIFSRDSIAEVRMHACMLLAGQEKVNRVMTS